ncbi:MAG: type IX secretion system sortase PorU, partial [Bacteroidales bacterium]|nr:type IX secretion system sortase PorU [Bacteroidales bacterium]
DLVSYGIDPASINPKHVRLYGNGNGMLPEDNNEFRYDDLLENAIYVYGEDDEVFDAGDFILFYGENQTEWNLNEESGWFEHKLNLYSDYTYYFLTANLGEGKRIENMVEPTGDPTHIVTTYDNYTAHQQELENLIKSGKAWYGEKFGETTAYNFNFIFSGLITTLPVHLKSEFAVRSFVNSSMEVTIDGTSVSSVSLIPVNPNSIIYARKKSDSVSFNVIEPEFTLSFIYDLPTDSSLAWLDYFELNFTKELALDEVQFNFRDISSVGEGNITKFKVSGADASTWVWNVTDPINIAGIDGMVFGSDYEFKIETDSLLEFVAFKGMEFPTPEFAGTVANQNIHAIEPADMIIITHEDFKAEAQQLADFRESFDGISTFVTIPEKVYNEFSSGAQDITAIRDFVKYIYDNSNGEKPENLLLFGDASYDYKDITKNETNYVPVWESPESLNSVSSYCTDDFFSEFDEFDKTSMLQIGIGRLPVKSSQEANAVVEKIIHYSSNEAAFGNWRNEIVSVADDEDGNIHLNQVEDLAEVIDTTDGSFNISKIYLDAYIQDTLANGNPAYTAVNQAITDKINDGVNIINYIGHGSYSGLAYERVLTEDDLENWENLNYYPFMFNASCDFGRFDDPDKYSLTEKAVLMEDKGMSAIIAATRATWASPNHTFQKNFFTITLNNPEYSLGKSLKLAKQQSGGFENNRKYCLFGDPAMRLVIPEYKIITEAINGVAVTEPLDTINPGEQIIATGFLTDSEGNNIYNFNGTMNIKIYDRARTVTTLGNDPNSIITDFFVQDSILLEFETNIVNGQFVFDCNLPHELNEEFGTIKLSYYAKDGLSDAMGHFSEIVVGGQPNSTTEYYQAEEFINFYPTVVFSHLNYYSNQDIENLKIEIFDISGKVVFSTFQNKIINGEQKQIDVSKLQKGLYILRAYSNDKMNNLKIIKQ